MMADELNHAFDQVNWHIESAAESYLQELPMFMGEVIFYAAQHARIGTQTPLVLMISLDYGDELTLQIEDNGMGLNWAASSKSHRDRAWLCIVRCWL